jgi:hypothetical protein
MLTRTPPNAAAQAWRALQVQVQVQVHASAMQVPVLTIDTRTRLPELAKAFGETRSGPRGL